jgi:hypothetical protein
MSSYIFNAKDLANMMDRMPEVIPHELSNKVVLITYDVYEKEGLKDFDRTKEPDYESYSTKEVNYSDDCFIDGVLNKDKVNYSIFNFIKDDCDDHHIDKLFLTKKVRLLTEDELKIYKENKNKENLMKAFEGEIKKLYNDNSEIVKKIKSYEEKIFKMRREIENSIFFNHFD